MVSCTTLEKGNIRMFSKEEYQGAISRIIDEYIPIHYEGTPTNQQTEDALLLQELVNEKLEQESRKDKLIVGSEWVCEVDCYHRHGEHDSGNIILVNELMGNDVRYSNSNKTFAK